MTERSAPPKPVAKPTDAMSVSELAAAVRYHNYRYFVLSSPEVSDAAFDRLTRRLREQAPEHPALNELVGDATATGEKVVHAQPMLSLDKCYDAEGLFDWVFPKRGGRDRVRAFAGGFIETPKVDGVAAAFRYNAAGRLVDAATRGDGTRGERFLANAREITELPKQLAGGPLSGPVEVRPLHCTGGGRGGAEVHAA